MIETCVIEKFVGNTHLSISDSRFTFRKSGGVKTTIEYRDSISFNVNVTLSVLFVALFQYGNNFIANLGI